MLSALISGGLSLLSGLGSRQSAKKQAKIQAAYEYVNKVRQEEQNAANERNFTFAQNANREEHGKAQAANAALGKRMLERASGRSIVEDAELGGFNPATWLSVMGGQYMNMNAVGYELQQVVPFSEEAFQGSQYMMNAPTAQVPSMLEVVGNAAQSGWNAYRADQRVAQSQTFQKELLQAQLSAIQKNGGKPRSGTTFFGSGQIPYSVTAGGAKSAGVGGLIEVKPHEVTAVDSRYPSQEPGRMPEVGFLLTPSGGIAPAMSKDAKDRYEEDLAGTIGWNIRNRLMPSLGFTQHEQVGSSAGWGYEWKYNPLLQEYQLQVKQDSRSYNDGAWRGRSWDGKTITYSTGESF